MPKKTVKKQKLLTFEQLLTIFRTMISFGWKAEIKGSRRVVCLKSPKGREYCYSPIGALVRFNGSVHSSGTPSFQTIKSLDFVSKTRTHPSTALSVARAANQAGSDTHSASIGFNRRRRQALLKAFGLT